MKALSIASLLILASCGEGAPNLQIADAWARETVAGQSGTAAYVTIENRGPGDDRLLGVSAQAPVSATLHQTSTKGGISSMHALDKGLDLPAGETVALEPGGAHIMISGLTGPLQQGSRIKLVLRFDRSGEKAVDFKVEPATGGMSH